MTRIGLDCKLYRNTAVGNNAYSSPIWTEIVNVKDVTLPLTKGEADASRRGSSWKTRIGTLKDASIDFQLIQQDGDASFTALLDSFLLGTPIDLLVLNGPITDTAAQGLRATCEVFNFQDGQPLEGAQTFDVSCKPCPAVNPGSNPPNQPIVPVWFEVPGAP